METFLKYLIVFSLGAIFVLVIFKNKEVPIAINNETLSESPYSGQEDREIKSLSKSDIESLENGTGVAFGGMAKLAELNGYPGPRHVLELKDQLDLTSDQLMEIEDLFKEMESSSKEIGTKILSIEQNLNDAFVNQDIDEELLENLITESGENYAKLRSNHLKYHLYTFELLDEDQIARYNSLRGYNSEDPCENIPEGHNTEMWKMHNGCL